VRARFGILLAGVALATLVLGGCPLQPGAANRPAGKAVVPPGGPAAPVGRRFDVVSAESLLTIRVYRAGPLAAAGHDHLIASRQLTGSIYVPGDLTGTTFELHVPVDGMTVDEPSLRAREGPDFSAAVPDSARTGTRRNMLGPALLDAEHFAQIVLRSATIGRPAQGALQAQVSVEIRGARHTIRVPVRYQQGPDEVVASGELPLKQTDLGLTPFSALLGALQVRDEMRVRFRIVAHRWFPGTGPARAH